MSHTSPPATVIPVRVASSEEARRRALRLQHAIRVEIAVRHSTSLR